MIYIVSVNRETVVETFKADKQETDCHADDIDEAQDIPATFTSLVRQLLPGTLCLYFQIVSIIALVTKIIDTFLHVTKVR